MSSANKFKSFSDSKQKICLLNVYLFLVSLIYLRINAFEVEFLEAKEPKPAGYLEICHRKDRNLGKCLKSSLEKFMVSVDSVSSENDLPSIDPIGIPCLKIQKGKGNVSLSILFENLTLSGLKNTQIITVKPVLSDNKFKIYMKIPYINCSSQYFAEGGVYTFPISGQGRFSFNMTDVSATYLITLGRRRNDAGVNYLTVQKSVMNVLAGNVDAHFGDSIDGSSEIGSAFNSFFNNYSDEIFHIIQPEVSDILAQIGKAIAEKILSRYPEKILLPD